MLLKISHETKLNYSELISETVMELRMAPRQEQCQHRLAFDLAIGPAAPAQSYFDFLGNLVHAFSVNAPHNEVRITAVSVVETNEGDAVDGRTDAYAPDTRHDYALLDYLAFSDVVADCQELRAMAGEIPARPGEPLYKVATSLMEFINTRFAYEKGVTTAASPISDILKLGGGVCQDFAHLMIGACRAMGIPSRYVSGFIYSGEQAYRGSSQTHAWCEVWFPEAGTWHGFDPTNNCVVGDQFVKIAVGRDYHDVPPNRGVYRGDADEHMDIQVQIDELPRLPANLRAERIRALDVPVFNGRLDNGNALGGGLHEQQEQQQQGRTQGHESRSRSQSPWQAQRRPR